jgi:hypothetical protein
MPRKKKAATPKKKPISKTAFVKSLHASTPGAEVVKRAKAEGLNVSLNYVYAIRTRLNAKRKPKAAPTAAAAPAKRGPGRPPKSASNGNGSGGVWNRSAGSLEAAIEAIVERKVNEILRGRLGALFG